MHTSNHALATMYDALETISAFFAENHGESVDAWEERMKESKKYIKDYQEQLADLLSLFENYVEDTTAYIAPLARPAMMRVDRNDICINLTQIESGVWNNVTKALMIANKVPFPHIFSKPTEDEIARGRINEGCLQPRPQHKHRCALEGIGS